MTWFVAHIVIGFMAAGDNFCKSAWENIVIIQADELGEARSKAERIGRRTASLDDGLTINDAQGERIFAGVRKIGKIDNPYVYDDENPLIDGCEITFLDLALNDRRDLEKLANGDEVELKYVI